jgi:hypothetical protein
VAEAKLAVLLHLALRAYFGWPPMRREPSFAEPTHRILDSLEGREVGFEIHVGRLRLRQVLPTGNGAPRLLKSD